MKNKIVVVSSSSTGEGLASILGLGLNIVKSEDYVFEENTLYLVVGYEAYEKVIEGVHLGLRNTKYEGIVELSRVGVPGNSSFIFTYENEWYVNRALKNFNDPNVEVPKCPEPPKTEIVRNSHRALEVINHLDSLPADQLFGFDYESNGLTNIENFLLTGIGLCTETESYFIDFRFLTDDLKEVVYERLKDFFRARDTKCIVFNVNFEYMATYRVMKEFFRFTDLNILNIMSSYGPWRNLKWTARRILNVNSWDEDFAEISNDIDYYIKDEVVDYEGIQEYFSKSLPDDQVLEIVKHLEVYPNGFYAVPSEIIGHYCGLDCYYTLMAYKLESAQYSQLALDVYASGKILESRINNQGMVKNIEFYNKAVDFGEKILLYSAQQLIEHYYNFCLNWVGETNPIEKYSNLMQRFLKGGIPIYDGYNMSKYLFGTRYYNTNYEWNLDSNLIYEDFGQEVGEIIIDMLWECVDSLDGIGRKRTVHTYIGDYIDTFLVVPEELIPLHENTINYWNYKINLEWIKSMPWIGTDYSEIGDTVTIEGVDYSIYEATQYILSVLNVNSNDNQSWMWEYWNESMVEFKIFTDIRTYVMDEEIQHLYTGDILKDFKIFQENFALLSDEAKQRALETSDMECSRAVWEQERLLVIRWLDDKQYPGLMNQLINDFKIGHVGGDPLDYLRFNLAFRLFNKFFKSVGTYLKGTFQSSDENYNTLDDNWISDWHWDEWDANKPTKSFAYYIANKQFSLRWSSGFHTLPSKSEVKRCMAAPPDALLTYFDISQAS